eukprot:scaffold263030_cov30-Tisochrysis_lutea.AAC.2
MPYWFTSISCGTQRDASGSRAATHARAPRVPVALACSNEAAEARAFASASAKPSSVAYDSGQHRCGQHAAQSRRARQAVPAPCDRARAQPRRALKLEFRARERSAARADCHHHIASPKPRPRGRRAVSHELDRVVGRHLEAKIRFRLTHEPQLNTPVRIPLESTAIERKPLFDGRLRR